MRIIRAFIVIGLLSTSGDVFAQDKSPSISGIPVRIIEDNADRIASDKREARNDERADSDLKAQWSAANAAQQGVLLSERQLIATWWQLVLAIVGTAALFISLIFTAISLRQTGKALRDAREIGETQSRAYFTYDGYDIDVYQRTTGAAISFQMKWKNTGNSPALNSKVSTLLALRPDPDFSGELNEEFENYKSFATVMGPGANREAQTPVIEPVHLNRWLIGQMFVAVASRIEFEDMFGTRFEACVCFKVALNPNVDFPNDRSVSLVTYGHGNYYRKLDNA